MLPKEIIDKDLTSFSNLSAKETLELLQSSFQGLSESEAAKRIKAYGKNTIKEEVKTHLLIQFLVNFKSPLVVILLVIAVFSAFTGNTSSAVIVMLMVFMSVVLNFMQEYKAGRAAEMLKGKLTRLTLVLRAGQKHEVDAREICVGDILELSAGDIIPADCRVISAKDLFANQSSLTGESFPAEKDDKKLDSPSTELTSMSNILFHGTSVVTGSAMAVVLKIGNKTEFGRIAQNLESVEQESEFTKGISDFSVFILKVIILFVIFILVVNSLLKHNFMESLLFSIAIAVGLTPEFLPMIMSVTMAKGSLNMSKKGVIVKKLAAIPSFGSMDILCTDKTGTLTEDNIQLVKYIDVYGAHSDAVLLHAYLNSSYQTGISNPMDKAVVDYKKIDISDYTKKDEIPFDFNRKRMSVVVQSKDKTMRLITKGAPEEIFQCCKNFSAKGVLMPIDVKNSQELMSQYLQLSSEGYRVLAVAARELPYGRNAYSVEDETDLNLLGYIAFLDPPKKDAGKTILELEKMGIEVKIITGDNELVSKKICSEVGLPIKGVMTGHELHDMSESELKHKINDITIFARFSPDDKNTIIRLLRENGHVVGYMGDGINDASSLKSADVGISVSNAVDVAKESADIILTTKSLEQLSDGVLEGRKTFGNTMKYIMMGISSNFGNMFSVLAAVVFLPFLPMLPIQILLNNFLYDFSQITIPTDNVDSDFVQKPKRWNIKFIRNFMITFGPISSFYDCTSYVVLYYMFSQVPGAFQTGWFLESLATQTLVIHLIRTRQIPFIQSRPSKYLLISTLLVIAVGWLIPFTPVGALFGFKALPWYALLALAGIVAAYLVTVEIAKRLFFRKYFDFQ